MTSRLPYCIFCLVLLCAVWHQGFAQDLSPEDLFPHHKGDVWQYVDFWYQNPKQNVITEDSLLPDGRSLVRMSLFGTFVVDTARHIIYERYGEAEAECFRLEADSGTVYMSRTPVQTLVVTVTSVSQGVRLFDDTPRTVKIYDFVDSVSHLNMWTYYLASGLGIIREDADTFLGYQIQGARIDSVLYGTVAAVSAPAGQRLPLTYALEQNFPNPFNPSTEIAYTVDSRRLTVDSKIRLTVYDLLGREVAVLVNERRTSGRYTVRFDGSRLASGVYLYRLQAGAYVETKTMLLLK